MTLKETFISTLKSTNRKGIDNVIKQLEKLGFFKAPASSEFHLDIEGGLLQHSINVYNEAVLLKKCQTHLNKKLKINDDSIAICALLHDICKSKLYTKGKKWKKDDNTGKWNNIDCYLKDFKWLPCGHGEKSVIMLLQFGLELTDEEILAIRWHMGKYDVSEYQDSKKSLNSAMDIPLVHIIHCADMLASHSLET